MGGRSSHGSNACVVRLWSLVIVLEDIIVLRRLLDVGEKAYIAS
jgi:hypothetical protein